MKFFSTDCRHRNVYCYVACKIESPLSKEKIKYCTRMILTISLGAERFDEHVSLRHQLQPLPLKGKVSWPS